MSYAKRDFYGDQATKPTVLVPDFSKIPEVLGTEIRWILWMLVNYCEREKGEDPATRAPRVRAANAPKKLPPSNSVAAGGS